MGKRAKTWLTGLLMVFGVTPAMAEDFTENGVHYNILPDNTVEVTHGSQPYNDYVFVPQSVVHNGTTYQVTAIGDEAFNCNTLLMSVSIPETVVKIGTSAFSGCSRMQYITLPNSLTTIGNGAFYGCKQLKTLVIPDKTSRIGNEAFAACTGLSSFVVTDENANFAVEDGVLFNKQKTTLIAYPNSKGKSYWVPNNVTTVGEQAFVHCANLEAIVLSTSLTTIEDAAFYGCEGLKKVVFQEGLKTIGVVAFSECQSLEQVSLPSTVTSIGDGAFSFCSELNAISVLSENSTYKSDDGALLSADGTKILAVPGKKSGSYSIPASVETISPQAFYGCDQLTTVVIPAGLNVLGDNPFLFCASLREMQVASSNTNFTAPDGVLYSKDKKNLLYYPNAKEGTYKVLDGVETLSNGPFFGSNALSSLSIPATVKNVDNWTFLCCEGLQSVFLPYQLNTLGQSAFKGCSSLQEIICAGLPLGVDDFDTEVYDQAKLYVPTGLTSEYQKATGWNGFKNVEEYGLFMPDGSALRGQSRIVSVNVAKGLPISSFQMELDMPEGVVLVEGEDGGKEVWLSEENAQTHQLHFEKKDNGKYLVAVRDDQNRELQGEDAVLYLNMQLTPDAPTGANIITLKDVNFTFNSPVVAAGEAEQIAMQRDMQTNLNVQVFKGDVNVNGRLNVADFVEDALYLKGSQTESFHFDEADVSNNGKVTIEDVNRTLNLIQEEQDLVVKTYFWDTDESSAESLSKKESWVVSGGVGRIKLTVPNALKTLHIPAYQFDIVLPPSVSLTGVENTEGVVSEIDTDENGNKVYRVVVASVEVENLLNADLLPSLIVESAAGTEIGTLPVSLQRVVLADANAKEYLLDDIAFDLLVNDDSGIANVYSEDGLFSHPQDIYNVNGQLVRRAAVSLDGLPAGIYIVGGQKITVGRF